MLLAMGDGESTRARWRGVVQEQRRSGQTVAAFCRARAVPQSSFFAWRRKLNADGSPGFVEARLAVCEPAAAVGRDGGVTIELACGLRIAVGRGFDRQLLLEVIAVLEADQGSGS